MFIIPVAQVRQRISVVKWTRAVCEVVESGTVATIFLGSAMRAILVLLPLAVCAFYLTDTYKYNGHYVEIIWAKVTNYGQNYEQELRSWWRSR